MTGLWLTLLWKMPKKQMGIRHFQASLIHPQNHFDLWPRSGCCQQEGYRLETSGLWACGSLQREGCCSGKWRHKQLTWRTRGGGQREGAQGPGYPAEKDCIPALTPLFLSPASVSSSSRSRGSQKTLGHPSSSSFLSLWFFSCLCYPAPLHSPQPQGSHALPHPSCPWPHSICILRVTCFPCTLTLRKSFLITYWHMRKTGPALENVFISVWITKSFRVFPPAHDSGCCLSTY